MLWNSNLLASLCSSKKILRVSVYTSRFMSFESVKTNINLQNINKPSVSIEQEKLHEKASDEKKLFYIDPQTNFKVMTVYAHKKRGNCCGNLCRHCPYEWINVEKKQ